MTHNWNLLGDRPSPPLPSNASAAGQCEVRLPSLFELPDSDAELFAVFAAVVARYLGRSEFVLGWFGAAGWESIAMTVDVGQPFADLVPVAARALARPVSARLSGTVGDSRESDTVGDSRESDTVGDSRGVPTVGVSRVARAEQDAPALLSVAADGIVRYSSRCYTEADVRRFVAHLTTLSAARHRDVPIAQLPLLTEDELLTMYAGNDMNTADETATLTDLIAVQVSHHPDVVAVRAGDAALTYAELWQRSGAVAARLRRDALIGVWADRSAAMMVGLLAVLRAGSAYVALDPSYPAARLAAVVRAAGLQAVVGPAEAGGVLRGVEVLPVDTAAPAPVTPAAPMRSAGLATPALSGPTDAGALAYVMFTSGSTGVPKGVMIEHRSVVNLLRHMAQQPGLRAGQTMLGVTTAAFDLSVPDLFLPLVTGATLVLADAADVRDGARLSGVIARCEPDLMQATPSTWRMLFDAGWRGAAGLRVVCGGEGYDAGLVRLLDEHVAGVWNFYGPTETTVWSVSRRLDGTVRDPIPMGNPMRGTACYVFDEHGEPVPPGVRGELYIAGHGLARGYLGQPELTERAFVVAATPAGPEARMYRTGDLVRIAPDGELTFVGRRDHQVKLNGFRIELGEVEAAVATLPGVHQAVAVVRTSGPVARLVCYVSGAGLDAAQLRAAAAELLPPQAVPSVVVVLPALPVNGNGKIDRAALPEPAVAVGAAPNGEFEQLVATVAADVLGLPGVYGDDDVFALGANSLDIGRIAIRLSVQLSIDIAPGLIFRHSSVRGLAAALVELLVGFESDLLAVVEGSP